MPSVAKTNRKQTLQRRQQQKKTTVVFSNFKIRYTRKVSVWPVGLVGGLKWEGPLCKDGSVIKFYTLWKPERPMPVDMAGFAMNVQLIIDNPNVEMDTFARRGYLESSIVSKLATREDFEPLADNCKQVFLCSYLFYFTFLFKLLVLINKGRALQKRPYPVALENSRHIATSPLVSPEVTSEKRAPKFHTNSVSLPKSG